MFKGGGQGSAAEGRVRMADDRRAVFSRTRSKQRRRAGDDEEKKVPADEGAEAATPAMPPLRRALSVPGWGPNLSRYLNDHDLAQLCRSVVTAPRSDITRDDPSTDQERRVLSTTALRLMERPPPPYRVVPLSSVIRDEGRSFSTQELQDKTDWYIQFAEYTRMQPARHAVAVLRVNGTDLLHAESEAGARHPRTSLRAAYAPDSVFYIVHRPERSREEFMRLARIEDDMTHSGGRVINVVYPSRDGHYEFTNLIYLNYLQADAHDVHARKEWWTWFLLASGRPGPEHRHRSFLDVPHVEAKVLELTEEEDEASPPPTRLFSCLTIERGTVRVPLITLANATNDVTRWLNRILPYYGAPYYANAPTPTTMDFDFTESLFHEVGLRQISDQLILLVSAPRDSYAAANCEWLLDADRLWDYTMEVPPPEWVQRLRNESGEEAVKASRQYTAGYWWRLSYNTDELINFGNGTAPTTSTPAHVFMQRTLDSLVLMPGLRPFPWIFLEFFRRLLVDDDLHYAIFFAPGDHLYKIKLPILVFQVEEDLPSWNLIPEPPDTVENQGRLRRQRRCV